ncbi:MAG: c-type cytochrome [Pseudomonadota bacterium]|nr:c-type cytochrome [Pseudomonadota bacterium]
MNRLSLLLPTLLCACTASLHDGTFPTGSQTLIANADHDALYSVDTDGGRVVRYEPSTGALSSVDVGLEPTRIARAGDRLFVSLRGSRSVAVLDDQGGTLSAVATFEVGAEPVGIVAREDGKRLYVALSAQNEIVEVDATTFAIERTWSVSGTPAWVALHPSGETLYVGSAMGGGIHSISLAEGGKVTELELPPVFGAGEDGTQRFTRRVTGDLYVSPDGQSVAVPAMYIDNSNPVGEPGEVETVSEGYGSAGLGVSRFNPAVVIVPTGDDGNPVPGDAATVLVAGFAELDDDDDGATAAVRSYLSSVTYSPDGSLIYASMEASQTVVVLSSTPIYPDTSAESDFREFDTGGGASISADAAGFASSPFVLIGTDAGPRGVAFLSDDEAYVDSFLDHTVGSLRAKNTRSLLSDQLASGFVSAQTFRGPAATEIAERSLDADVEAGRRLFFSATSTQMAADGAGVSCSTCHYQGSNDGLTWTFEDGVRQTPTLRGAVSVTAPFTWTDQVGTVSDEAQITSSGRMGGSGMSYAEAAQVAAYIESNRAVDLPMKGATTPEVLRGKAIFERADVACATCHSGERLTDNEHYTMFGLDAVNTPTLVGVAASGPYLHDGSASSLEAVLQMSRSGEMGDTSMLSDDEMADLEAYLHSL